MLHLSAEINPLFVAAGLAASGTSSEPGARRTALEAELAADIGAPSDRCGPEERDVLAADVAWRLSMQWPQEIFDVEVVRRFVDETG